MIHLLVLLPCARRRCPQAGRSRTPGPGLQGRTTAEEADARQQDEVAHLCPVASKAAPRQKQADARQQDEVAHLVPVASSKATQQQKKADSRWQAEIAHLPLSVAYKAAHLEGRAAHLVPGPKWLR